MSLSMLKASVVSLQGYGRLLGSKLDIKDAKILETVYRVGPRNLSEVSRVTGLPLSTIYRRIYTMRKLGIRLRPTIIPERVGLGRALVITERDIIDRDTSPAGHWLSTYMPLISPPGSLLIYYYPIDRPQLIDQYFKRAKRDGIVEDYTIIKLINAYNSPENLFKYFDFNTKSIILPWEEWINNLYTEEYELFYKEPLPPLLRKHDPLMPRDRLDLLILKELEVDALASFTELARRINVPEHSIRFHFHSHINERGVVHNYVPKASFFDLRFSYHIVYLIRYGNFEGFTRFLMTLWRSPILLGVGKLEDGPYDIIMSLIIPYSEIGNLNRFFKLSQHWGFIKRYKSFAIDMTNYRRRSIPYKNFDPDLRRWIDKP